MARRIFRYLQFLAALALTFSGFMTMVGAPFLPLYFLDLEPPPNWLSVPLVVVAGFTAVLSGIWLSVITWKRCEAG